MGHAAADSLIGPHTETPGNRPLGRAGHLEPGYQSAEIVTVTVSGHMRAAAQRVSRVTSVTPPELISSVLLGFSLYKEGERLGFLLV